MASKILITGGSGFIGSHLNQALKENQYEVNLLSSKKSTDKNVFYWNIEKGEIDRRALDGVDIIIHLAGASIAGKRWTAKRKQEIIESRTKSAELLFEKLKSTPHTVKTFISASGVGIYGNNGDEWVDENHTFGKDFLAHVCQEWELAARKIESLGIRVVVFRQGMVLGNDGGALPVMARPVKFFVGAPLGNGRQYISWIHIDDLCRLYIYAIKKETMHEVFNAVAPNPITNKDFTKMLGQVLHRPIWPFAIPAFHLKTFLGEQASIVLYGQRVSNKRIISERFHFRFSEIEGALKSFY